MDCNANEILAGVTTTWVTSKGTMPDFSLVLIVLNNIFWKSKMKSLDFFVMLFADDTSASF